MVLMLGKLVGNSRAALEHELMSVYAPVVADFSICRLVLGTGQVWTVQGRRNIGREGWAFSA